MKRETPLMREVQLAIGSRGDVVLFRNNVGMAWQGRKLQSRAGTVLLDDASPIKYGLCVGSADLVGWTMIDGLAVFTALEIKTMRGRVSPNQKNFIAQVEAAGGIVGVARSVDEAAAIIDAGIVAIRAGQKKRPNLFPDSASP